jgi:hypothetical protein
MVCSLLHFYGVQYGSRKHSLYIDYGRKPWSLATYRQCPLPVRFNDYENRELLENGSSWTRNVCRTPIANQGRPTEWLRYFHHASPLSGSFRFRSVQKSWITRERWQLDEKHVQNTNSKSGPAYQMVKLLQLGGATCC